MAEITRSTPHEFRTESRKGKPLASKRRPVVTISRQLESGGTAIARQLGKELGWQVWDRELVDKIANDTHAERQIVERFDEHAVSEIDEVLRTFLSSTTTISSLTYIRHLFSLIMSIGQRGEAIIVGRGANLILPSVLNVRVFATLEHRIENLVMREDIPRKDAEQRIIRSDQERADFTRKIYSVNINDPIRYDLILRMDDFSIEDAVQIIHTSLRMKFPHWKKP